MPRVFLGLGSNQGRSHEILEASVERLAGFLTGLRSSSIYVSSPMYVTDQPPFLNMAVAGDCALPPLELLDSVQSIEASFGRDRSRERPKGERPLDIDILLYGEETIEHPRLRVPHPGMLDRKFVLLPLLEIDPSLAMPGGRILAEAVEALGTQGIYYYRPTRYSFPHTDERCRRYRA